MIDGLMNLNSDREREPSTSGQSTPGGLTTPVSSRTPVSVLATSTRSTLRDAQPVRRISPDHWKPALIAAATGYSVSQVSRVFSDDPNQRRWRWAAEAFVALSTEMKITPTAVVRLMIRALERATNSPDELRRQPYYAPAVGFTRIAECMQITLEELFAIVLDD